MSREIRELSCNKDELIELFKSARLLKKEYSWYLDDNKVKIYAIYNQSAQYVTNINDTNKYKIVYSQKEE
jgi:hypothetical protein